MKRLLLINIVLMLSVIIASCGQYEGNTEGDYVYCNQDEELMVSEVCNQDRELMISEVIEQLEFSSLEDFLNSYIAVKEDNIDDVVADWTSPYAEEDIANVIKHIDFAGLEKFYLPTNIPETYTLFNISINESFVHLWYLPEEDLICEDTKWYAISQGRDFLFGFIRRDMDNPKQELLDKFGLIEEELIDGRYVFRGSNLFLWASERNIMYMYIPLQSRTSENDELMEGGIARLMIDEVEYSVEEVLYFCQVRAVNLLDINEIMRLIEDEVRSD